MKYNYNKNTKVSKKPNIIFVCYTYNGIVGSLRSQKIIINFIAFN